LELIDPKSPLSKSTLAKKLQDPKADMNDPDSAVSIILGSILTSTAMPEYVTPKLLQDNRQKYVNVANKHNDPGKFTTLIAYEWTSIPNGRNRHPFSEAGDKRSIVTDRLRSYRSAMTVIGNAADQECGRWLNNRAENSQLAVRIRGQTSENKIRLLSRPYPIR
jgi:hypothetical protein